MLQVYLYKFQPLPAIKRAQPRMLMLGPGWRIFNQRHQFIHPFTAFYQQVFGFFFVYLKGRNYRVNLFWNFYLDRREPAGEHHQPPQKGEPVVGRLAIIIYATIQCN